MKRVIFFVLIAVLVGFLVYSRQKADDVTPNPSLIAQGQALFADIVQGSGVSKERLAQVFEQLPNLKVLLPVLPDILAVDGVKHYILLFQNNMELRPTGGFLGSYAVVTMDHGALKDVAIQDIYVPDGKIKGYVKEPEPIKKYLFSGDHPGWRLRDSNWNPDFPTAAADMRWFFNEGGVGPIDGMIAINLFPIIDLLKIFGPIDLPDYGMRVSADSFYGQAQEKAETNFFPGSTQKKDFLSAVGKVLLNRVMRDGAAHLPELTELAYHNFTTKQIMVFFDNQKAAEALKKLSWDGALWPVEHDYLAINEANVGINKANCCIDRTVADTVTVTDAGLISHHLTVTYKNNNPAIPQPPLAWGGGYKNYLRVFVPAGVEVENPEKYDIEQVGDKTSIGQMILIEGGQTGQATVVYTLPKPLAGTYQLQIQKQSGIDTLPYILTFKNIVRTYAIEKDQVISVP